MIKYFSEKFLTKAIYFLTFVLALTPGMYTNSVIYPYVTAKTIAFRIIISIMLFLYIVLVLKNKKYLPSKNSIVISFALFLVACFFSGIFSLDPSQSFWSTPERMIGTFNMIHFFLFFLILSCVFKTKEMWIRMINLWNILIVSAGTIALYNFISTHLSHNTSIFSDRFYGFAGNPIFFAAVILIFFYLNLYLFFEKLPESHKNKRFLWHIPIAIMYIIFIFLTGSRGAFLALGITGVIFFISLIVNPNYELNNWLKIDVQRISLIIFVFLFIGIASIFVFKRSPILRQNYLVSRLTSINLNDGASFSRIIVSKIGLNCFFQKPILGWGFDNFEICYQHNFDTLIAKVLPKETRFDKTHDMPIEILATTGIVGFIFYMGIYFYGYKNIRDLMLQDKISFYSGLSIILAIIAYFIQNLFVFDVFEGLIALCFVLALIVFLKQDENIKINLDKLSSKVKNLIIAISFVLIALNIYWFNLYIFYYDSLVKKVDHLISNGQTRTALNQIKNTKNVKSPYIDALYYGFFDIFVKNQKKISELELKEYYQIAFENQKEFHNKYPYRTRIYLSQLVHIASKAINPDIKIGKQDVQNAREIIEICKKRNIKSPDLDFFFIQILFNSKDSLDWKQGEEIAKKDIELYPEIGKFYWVYAIHLIEVENRIKEGIEYLKQSYKKDIVFESIDQLITTVYDLNKYNEPDTAILFLNKYIPGNPTRFQLYMELSHSYMLKKDYSKAKEALDTAKKIYEEQRSTRYSAKVEEELEKLTEKLNNLKNEY